MAGGEERAKREAGAERGARNPGRASLGGWRVEGDTAPDEKGESWENRGEWKHKRRAGGCRQDEAGRTELTPDDLDRREATRGTEKVPVATAKTTKRARATNSFTT